MLSIKALEYSGKDNLVAMQSAVNYNNYILQLIIGEIAWLLRYRETLTVMDFGAGIGQFAKPVKQYLEDNSPESELICMETDTEQQQTLDVSGLLCRDSLSEIADSSVDIIYSINVLEHIEEDESIIKQMMLKLKPGGRLLIYVPAFPVLYSRMDSLVGHYRRYRKKNLVNLIKKYQGHVYKANYVDTLGFPISLLYRFFSKGNGTMSANSVEKYDTLVFPLSREIDDWTGGIIGKNLLVFAWK